MGFNNHDAQVFDALITAYQSGDFLAIASNSTLQEELQVVVGDIVHYKVYVGAVATLLFWEYLVTVNRERQLYWHFHSWSFVKILFFINRYYGLAFCIVALVLVQSNWVNQATCSRIYMIIPISFAILLAVCQGILCLRIWAIWARQRAIMILLSIAWSLVVGCMIATLCIGAYSQVPIVPAVGLTGCLPLSRAPKIFLFWLPGIVLDCALLSRFRWNRG